MRPNPMTAPPIAPKPMAGQALVETVVALGVLTLLWLAALLLGRYQDMALQARHASRLAVFQQAQAHPQPAAGLARWVDGPGQRWHDPAGRTLYQADASQIQLSRGQAPTRQPGGALAQAMRRDWQLEDSGVAIAHATLSASRPAAFLPETRPLRLRRHSALLTDSGAAPGDDSTQARLGRSATAWRHQATLSQTLATALSLPLQPLELGWGRRTPGTDWLTPWTAAVPADRLTRRSLP